MIQRTSKQFWPALLALAALMAITRSHHVADITHLPDASWTVFFLAGFYFRSTRVLAVLLGVAAISDYLAIEYYGVGDFCISPAYPVLGLAYGALWLAGRAYLGRYRFDLANLLWLSAFGLAGALICEVLSSGSFYWLSGRSGDFTLGGFVHAITAYFPSSLAAFSLYLSIAVAVHAAFVAVWRGAYSPLARAR